ncbi:MAG: DUF3737 family protein [Lachnospiraceae bacterium]|nr:DUF3737 family protein [Lachnospiraceae bacterium]
MMIYRGRTFDEERALYGSDGVEVVNCRFEGPADGESALKESRNVKVSGTYFNLRYPFWHDKKVLVKNSEFTKLCRAAFWYSEDVRISGSRLFGIKAVRECKGIAMDNCEIASPEFGWSVHGMDMVSCKVEGDYFMLRSDKLNFDHVALNGKYSFQYISDSEFVNCEFDTKDAFWHAKNVIVRNSVVKGEYLGWYCENVTFENCTITGTQPLCYCKGLRLIDCEMHQTDLAFEKSEVDAVVLTEIDSIRNPKRGTIKAPSIGNIIMDDPEADARISST